MDVGRLRVLSIPAGHVYPKALRPAAGWPDIEVLDDPVLDPAEPDRWWPHPALRRHWWEQGDRRVDLCHLHFGFEHLSLPETRDFLAVLDQRGIPLVVTVHDLDNPHLADQTSFHLQLGLMVAAAAEVLTLSSGAAEIIEHRYGRTATVVPHPAVVTEPAAVPAGAREGVGVFLKSLRANIVAEPTFYRALADGLGDQIPLRIYLHRDRAESDLARELPGNQLRLHEPMDDPTLFSTVTQHHAVILPYERGTHSGWLEMCLDLGVSVAVPDCGCYRSQAGESTAVAEYRTGDGADAARAANELLRSGPAPRQDHHFDNVSFHHRLYQRLRRGID